MSEVKEIKIDNIVLSKTNPRKEFNKNSLQELADSIETSGLVNPVTVRKKGSNFELVTGERRFRAMKLLKKKSILSFVRTLTDEQVLEIQYIENLQRQDVHPLDEATFISGMLDTGKFTIETIADKIGKTKAYVAGRLQLTKLIPKAHKMYAAGEIELGHALLLAKLQPADQKDLLENDLSAQGSYGYTTVADLKESIQRKMLNLNEAPFKINDKLLLESAGSCTACPKRTGNALDLFCDFSGKNICTDPACYEEKVRLEIERKIYTAEQNNIQMVKVVSSHHGNKAEGVYGWMGYERYNPKEHKQHKDLVKKGIQIDGPYRGKTFDLILKEDIKLEEKKAVAKDPVKKEESIKEKVEKENFQIKEVREQKLRESLCNEILEQDLSKAILLPVIREIVDDCAMMMDDFFEFEDHWDVKKTKNASALEIVERFNRGAVKKMSVEESCYNIETIYEICEDLNIKYTIHQMRIDKENPLVTADDIKKRIKEGKKKEADQEED